MSAAHARLQLYLQSKGFYSGELDGLFGPKTSNAILDAFEAGPDTPLTDADYGGSARRLACPAAYIKAFAFVEANGSGFFNGKPKILFEPHRFSKNTGHIYDQSHPDVSYLHWGDRPYPPSQDGRYAQLLHAVALDPVAAFASASYGKFQIMGENAASCGYPGDPWVFAFAMAQDELTELLAFEKFIGANGILPFLRSGSWGAVALRYNGTAYQRNQYDVRLAQAAHRFMQAAG